MTPRVTRMEQFLQGWMSRQKKQPGTVVDLHLAASAKQAEAQRQMNRAVLLIAINLLSNQEAHSTTTFEDIIELQIANGDELLKQHVEQGPSNAQYTSKFCLFLDRSN